MSIATDGKRIALQQGNVIIGDHVDQGVIFVLMPLKDAAEELPVVSMTVR